MCCRPASRLLGLRLEGGWKVVELLKRPPAATGGHFSVSYKVIDQNGRTGFLKALDFSKAFQDPIDTARALEAMTKAYNFERDILKKCKNQRLSKIIIPITDGSVNVPGEVSDYKKVMYLIFELADGDVRKFYNLSKKIDLAWCLRSLHNTAVGLRQLHSRGIAHQDLKPSNIFFFNKKFEFKLSDLGKASDREYPCENDEVLVPGDMGYAPFELLYGYAPTNEFYKRYGIDLYLLGSMIFFYFSDISATQAIKLKLSGYSGPSLNDKNFINVLPYIKKAFFEAVKDLEMNIQQKAGKLTNEIIIIVKELCEPDPAQRGHPLDRKTLPYNLEKYVSRLNLLAKKAELGIY